MRVVLLAPGPSMGQEVADSVRGQYVGVVTSAYTLAPWADFLAANDGRWWMKNPEARDFRGRKFSANDIFGVEKLPVPKGINASTNSGVLALECAKHLGATRILLLGFDMSGTHFFGPYRNGLSNTAKDRRIIHHRQFNAWREKNPDLDVVNCAPGSALKAFPMMPLDAALAR